MKQYKPEDHLNLVRKVVNKLCARNPALYNIKDDLVSEGFVTLCEVCKSFQDTKGGVKFSTYTVTQVHNRILNYLIRGENNFMKLARLEDIVVYDSEDGGGRDETSWEDYIEGSVVDIPNVIQSMPEHLKEFLLVYTTQTRKEGLKTLGMGKHLWAEMIKDCKDFFNSRNY